ncbi:biopolymer transporter ExbD [Flavobacteriaceae bacterium 3-367]|uniref:ExbD/TolR family protein n=1 Tax=Eudoraea algarum TaxID=3417568 RepID=UPI00326C13B3
MAKRLSPGVHAGSMADIAFLLLIFFLVTTSIETDAGLDRMLPRMETPPPLIINERNILRISINDSDELLVEEERVDMGELRDIAIAFLDNGGAPPGNKGHCNYCEGLRKQESSDNPLEAVVLVTTVRATSYGGYITVQNELVAAYNHLRNREAQRRFGEDFTEMQAVYLNPETPEYIRASLREKIREIQGLFPLNLSEAEIK